MSSSLDCIKYSHPRELCFQRLIINAESLTLLISAGKLCLHLWPFTKAYTKGGGRGVGGWPPQAANIHRRNCRTVSVQVVNYKRTQTQLVSFRTDSRGSNRQFSTMDSCRHILKLNRLDCSDYKPLLWAQKLFLCILHILQSETPSIMLTSQRYTCG